MFTRQDSSIDLDTSKFILCLEPVKYSDCTVTLDLNRNANFYPGGATNLINYIPLNSKYLTRFYL